MSVLPMWIATLSRAVARPFSYVVSPVEVISIGAFSGVFISPQIKPALEKRATSNKTSVRIADAKGTAPKAPCKAKTALCEKMNIAPRAEYERLQSESHPRSLLINLAINGFLHTG